MSTKKEPLTPHERVSLCLRSCALVLDPRKGHLKSLAADLEVHETTLSLWMREGRVPPHQARRLRKRFGKTLVNVDLITSNA